MSLLPHRRCFQKDALERKGPLHHSWRLADPQAADDLDLTSGRTSEAGGWISKWPSGWRTKATSS